MEMTKLLVKDLMNGKFELFSDYVYKTKEYFIKVPKGFVTDYASIPKLLRAIVLPYGKHSGASVVHDWLYSSNCDLDISREKADRIFLEILKEEKVNFFLRNLMYFAVRKFGRNRFRNGV
ncbi:DUF1353 domain-containing protein [Fusobacterium animalis]|uniref:Uncharacterized protein n=1 Tax=Fusobacterium animalis TaxID=76859 RepID=A0A0M4RMJ2_9FUSO|nr:DUF1353 domain-containing protein [Fusobacterium animalis]ALF16822.1 hypothetical protein RN98_00780 [Fusobacterium animalis]QYR68939.1 DUF1353 domain-containing protein [Fusobacterium animalis]